MNHKRPTQAQRVLDKLQEVGEVGVWNHEFVNMKPPILRYSARIKELRDQGWQIKTKKLKAGYYKYFITLEPVYKLTEIVEEEEVQEDEYQSKRKKLIALYKMARLTGRTEKMEEIRLEGLALNEEYKNQVTFEQAKEIFK